MPERNFMRKVEDSPLLSTPQVASGLVVDFNIKVSPQMVSNAIKKGYSGCPDCRNQ